MKGPPLKWGVVLMPASCAPEYFHPRAKDFLLHANVAMMSSLCTRFLASY
jgi:hypothetical protein